MTYAHWAAAILANGLGRYAAALAAARHASQDSPALYMAGWALPELIEAAARTANTRLARDALARLTETTQAGQRLPGLIKDIQLVVIEGGPHAIAWTHAGQVNAALLDFLRS